MRTLALAFALSLTTGPASAQAVCRVTPQSSGVLTADASMRTLSTMNPGGQPATFEVFARTGGTLQPLLCSLVAPQNCYRLRRSGEARAVALSDGSAVEGAVEVSVAVEGRDALLDLLGLLILNGTSTVRMNMTIRLPAGRIVRSGSYEAMQDVVCSR